MATTLLSMYCSAHTTTPTPIPRKSVPATVIAFHSVRLSRNVAPRHFAKLHINNPATKKREQLTSAGGMLSTA